MDPIRPSTTTLTVKPGVTISLSQGMQFATRKEATRHIKDFALAQGKCAVVDTAKSGGNSVVYICSSKTECSFTVRLCKSQRPNSFDFHISSLTLNHEGCSGIVKVTAAQVAAMPTAAAAVHANSALDGPSLRDKIVTLEGVDVPLRMLYRVREALLEDTSTDYLDVCRRVESLLTLFRRANPTAHTSVQYTPAMEFKRAFLSHPDVLLLRETSQAVMGLDGAFLKHKGADNVMLDLVGRNGNLENVILAVAICPAEDEDNCAWFMNCCISAGIGLSSQPVFSDRGSGIIAAAGDRGINLHYCTRHILGNMKAKFKGQVTACVERWLWDIQGATSELEFESKVSAFAIGFPDVVDYIRKIEPARWALYPHSQSTKLYGWRTTNFVESENAKALHARGRNPALFFQFFMEKWMKTKFKRYTEVKKWTNFVESENAKALHARGRNPALFIQFFMEKWMKTKFKRYTEVKKWISSGKRVTPKARALMEEQAANARFHDISLSNDDVGFVRDMRGSPPVRRRVNLREKSCTCSFFFQYGVPCAHICSMLAFTKQPERVFEFFDSCYLVDTYMQANDASVTNIELVIEDAIMPSAEVQAPQVTRKRGRPKTKRIPSEGETGGTAKKTKCSRCGQLGHNRRTCHLD